MKYVVTNVRLEAQMFRSLKLRAVERGVPASVLIREALRGFLTEDPLSKEERERAWQDLMKFAGSGRSKGGAVSTGSTDIDDVLYGPRLYKKRKP